MLPKQPPVARQPLEQLTQQQQQENVNKAAGQQVSCIKSLSSRWFCWLTSQSFAVSSVLWRGWSTGRASDLSKSAPVIPKCFCFWRDPAQRRATSEMKATHTHTQPFYCLFWDYAGEPVPEEILFWLYRAREISEADTSTIRLSTIAWVLISDPPPSSSFLCQIPFLSQPSHFILAWDRRQIWLAYPLAWLYPVALFKKWRPVK